MPSSAVAECAPLAMAIGFLLALVAIELAAILHLDDGMLVYTLDDPYIHLALAENIWHGHYGINSSESSAPSSSILWPFLLTPFASLEWFPLILNILAASATLVLYFDVLRFTLATVEAPQRIRVVAVVLGLLVLATNMIGLIFTGMEHSLQVFVVCTIGYGLILHVEQGRIAPWLWLAILIAPLVRYEDLGISAAALFYLLLQRQFAKVFITSILIAASVGLFSAFLVHLGLDAMPSSIIVKSSVVNSKGNVHAILYNLGITLQNKQGVLMALGALALLVHVLFAADLKKRQLALATIPALFAHFGAGSYGWYNRYELYVWSFFLMVGIYLSGDPMRQLLAQKDRPFAEARLMVVLAGIGFLASFEYLNGMISLPIASNNIYEQQYQMHRFSVDYYKKPIAVNDIGYLAYKNDQFILDLWGLGSVTAYRHRTQGADSDWMKRLTEEHDVELAMIYDEFWMRDIPESWIKLGVLKLGKKRVTPASSNVVFYATNPSSSAEVIGLLRDFEGTLPEGVEFAEVAP